MNRIRYERGQLVSVAVTALLSAVLFYSGFFTFLFAVPVQVAFSRHGDTRGMVAAGATGAAIIVVHAIQAMRISPGSAGLVLLDVLMPLGLLAGLTVFNVVRRYPWWLRLLAGGGVAL